MRKALEASLIDAEKIVFKATKAFFEDQEARVLAKLKSVKARRGTRHWDFGDRFDPTLEKKTIDPKRVFDATREDARFQEAMGPELDNVMAAFGEGTSAQFGTSFNLHDPAVSADILARSNRLVGVTMTTWEKVQEAILDGEIEGESIEGIAKRIRQVFRAASGYRSRMIARTETIGAANSGAFHGARQSGVVGHKVWLAAVDHRTRSSHLAADGLRVPLDEKFQVGLVLMDHPGDPAGGASQVINCRCTMLFERLPSTGVEDGGLIEPEADLPPLTDDQWAVLLPKRGGWTTTTRAKTLAKLKETPAGKMLAQTIDRFQSGTARQIPLFRTQVEKRLAGEAMEEGAKARVDNILGVIRHGPGTEKDLFRGMRLDGTADDLLERYVAGETLDLNISSFSTDRKLAQSFTIKGAGQRGARTKTTTGLRLDLVGDKRGLPVENLGKSRIFAEEKEWITAGRFSIEDVKVDRTGTVVVRIVQTGVL